MKDYKGKIAFITGGASGAGLGQAKLFGGLGAKVTIVDIRQEAIDKAVAELKGLGIDALGIQMDLTNREQYIAAADKAEKHWGGPPHLLFNTAGVNSFGPAEASTFEDYDWILGVNLFGVINGLCIFVPRMIKAYGGSNGVPREEAHICIVSSMGAFDGYSTDAPYSVSKAAVNNLAFSYYDALKPYGIGVTVQCPANINSNIGEAIKTRPAHLQNTGYYTSEGTMNMLKSIHATGMDPIKLAETMKYAMENGLPICIPSYGAPGAQSTQLVERSAMAEQSFNKVLNWMTVEGMEKIKKDAEEQAKRQAEMMAQFAKQREEFLKKWETEHPGEEPPAPPSFGFGAPSSDPSVPMETFGQARADLDWVSNHKH
jgi:NAD(P)-dependent dehydrogenase (short-subunit alcohol dehydrogenase family)